MDHALLAPYHSSWSSNTHTHTQRKTHQPNWQCPDTFYKTTYAHMREQSLETLQHLILSLSVLQKELNQFHMLSNVRQSWRTAGKWERCKICLCPLKKTFSEVTVLAPGHCKTLASCPALAIAPGKGVESRQTQRFTSHLSHVVNMQSDWSSDTWC